MLLEIIDITSSPADNRRIRLNFQSEKENISFDSDYLSSPLSRNFSNTLDWYFANYLLTKPWENGDKDVVGKLISLGNEMGDKLLGEDHELMKVTDIIENTNFDQLTVHIESTRLDFFQEQWETLILPESPYMLSTICKSFERIYNPVEKASHVEKHYDLSKDSPFNIIHVVSHIAAYNHAHLNETNDETNTKPATHLGDKEFIQNIRHTYTNTVELQSYNGSINYRATLLDDWQQLTKQLQETSSHIIHYTGPVQFNADNEPCLVCGDKLYSFKTFAQLVDRKNTTALVLELTDIEENDSYFSSETLLASIAEIVLGQGLHSMVGLSNIADPWTSQSCLSEVYHAVANGCSLSQAVVEARKSLQKQTQSDQFYASSTPFQSWSLLRHYSSGGELLYFSSPQQRTELQETSIYKKIRENLFGFTTDYFPPQASTNCDGILLEVVENASLLCPVNITGDDGSGKTQLLHRMAYLLIENKNLNHGFYFDVNEHSYSKSDILDMIASVLAKTVAKSDIETKNVHSESETTQSTQEQTLSNLKKTRSLFVLDNFSNWHGDDNERETLIQFLNYLSEQKQIVVLSGSEAIPQIKNSLTFAIPKLTMAESKVLAAATLRELDISDAEKHTDFEDLLKYLNGNPLLIKNILPRLQNNNCNELLESLSEHISEHSEKFQSISVQTAYHWQWSQLDDNWQHWLKALIIAPSIVIEMISMVCEGDKKTDAALALLEMFGSEKAAYSEGIKAMQLAGFISPHSHGKMINPKTINFIKDQRKQDELFIQNGNTIDLLCSRLICQALSGLLVHIRNNHNASLSQYLLMSRSIWAQRLEYLWFNEEYRQFLDTYTQLNAFLQQNQCAEEFSTWCLDIIRRSELLTEANPSELEKMITWLRLATEALSSPQCNDEHIIHKMEFLWSQWLNNNSGDSLQRTKPDPLLHNSINFLQKYYRKQQDWLSLYNIALQADKEYTQFNMWPMLVHTLFTLCDCCVHLNKQDSIQPYEERILNQLPFDELPQGYKTQLSLRIITSRISRADTDLAQALLNELKLDENIDKLVDVVAMLQADIHFKKKDYRTAKQNYQDLLLNIADSNPEQKKYVELQIKQCKQQLEE